MWGWIAYLFVSIFWGLFALRIQKELYGGPLWKLALCWFANTVFCPISIVIAFIRCPLEKTKDHNDEDSIFNQDEDKSSYLFE